MNGLNGDFDDRDTCACSIGYTCTECQTRSNRSKYMGSISFAGSISFGSNTPKAVVDPSNTFFDRHPPVETILDEKIKKKIAARKAKETNVTKRQERKERERRETRISNARDLIDNCIDRENYNENEGFGPFYFMVKYCYENQTMLDWIIDTLKDISRMNLNLKTLDDIVRLEDLQEAWNRKVVQETHEE